MKFEKFEDILAWQKAELLTINIYKLFKDCGDYSFKRQVERAVISIMNNIAEGFERQSNKEFKYFLFIAKGSCGEVRSMLHVASKLGYIEEGQYSELKIVSTEISKMLSGLIKKL